MQSFFKSLGKLLQLDQLSRFVRQAAFQDLGMTHTCFDKPRENPHGLDLDSLWDLDQQDEGVWEEVDTSKDDYEKAVYLNEFVADFEDFMLGSSEDASTEEHSDDLHKVDYRRALVFWNEIRPKRMREIKKSLAETWDPDLEILKDLGVSLWYEEDEEDDTESGTSEDERARHFGKFLKDLEDI
ncbi:hypothetical protein HYE68_004140 [Fusarium pseudograminearum]|nr:hypothetical protein HYE68_004140 [Fusarium pseudograminearum]